MSPSSDFFVADRRRRRKNHDGPLIYLVAAVAANGVIGLDGQLPWRIPEDLRFFKAVTLGHPVIMGRRTWQSLPGALPGRQNVVVTRTRDFAAPGATIAHSLQDALVQCAAAEAVYVIGGAALFAEALALADGLVITEIHRDYRGDTRFPDYERRAWREARRDQQVAADGTKLDFVLYERAA